MNRATCGTCNGSGSFYGSPCQRCGGSGEAPADRREDPDLRDLIEYVEIGVEEADVSEEALARLLRLIRTNNPQGVGEKP